jgi:hypothetical protein
VEDARAPCALTATVGAELVMPLVTRTGPFDWLVLIERQRSWRPTTMPRQKMC